MNKEKILRWLHALVNILTAAPLLAGSISPTKAVTVIAISTAVKEIVLTLGDLFDDWQLNKSFSAIAFAFLVLFAATGCVSYRDPDGTRFTSFLQKSSVHGLNVSKSGMRVKDAETQGDGDFLRSLYEAGKAAGAEAAKAAK